MSNPLPSDLALTVIQDGAEILSSDHRNNYAAIQNDVNQLIAALSGGTAGQFLQAYDSSDIGWVSGVSLKLWDSVEAGITLPVASITTPTLSQSFKHLRVVFQAANTATASEYVYMRVNGDSSATTYFGVHLAGLIGGTTTYADTGNSGMLVGQSLPSSDLGATVQEFIIPDYAAAHRHSIVGHSFDLENTSSGAMAYVAFGQAYVQATAISTLTFFLAGGYSFAAPTRITVYGLA